MLSRVAAVKAPNKHNRRRVTGSSGRRREGGESERQRSNMSRRVFNSTMLLLLLVMMCCSTGGAVKAAEPEPGPGSLPKTYYVWRDKKDEEKVSSLRVPSLFEVNGDVFAVAEAEGKDGSEKLFTGIASELLALGDKPSEAELEATQVKTEVLVECPSDAAACVSQNAANSVSQSEKRVDVSRPTTVVNGSEIYMLVGKYSRTAVAQESVAGDWGFLLVKGEVSKEGGGDKRIKWKNNNDVSRTSFETQHKSLTGLIGSGGLGVYMVDGRLLFPVEGTMKESEPQKNSGKTVSLIIYSSDIANWKLSREMSDGGCSVPSVVEWKGKLMMMTACDDGRRRVYESGDKGDSWTEALGTLSRVWGNKKDEEAKAVGSGLTTAKIDNRDVMLVTLPVYSKKENGNNNGKSVLHLWLTDNTHIVDIGPVSGDEDAAASSLLYRSGGNDDKKELIALYEKKKGGEKETSPGMVSVLLTAQLERVKEVLKTWNEVDKRVSQLCPSENAKEDPSPATACGDVEITDGLVGFLSGKFSDGTWRDEYLGVNATVKKNDGVEIKENGVTFKGRGAWAEWPVGSQEENQLYHFANYNFTLVATVSTDKVPEEDTPISLMGAKTNGAENTVLLGLSYSNKEKKWMLLCGGGTKSEELSSSWEPETTHQVAIVLQNGTQGTAYVDGQPVGDASCELGSTESQEISHFFIGGEERSAGGAGIREDVSVTVTNVLLYNRPLSAAEVGALNPNKAPIPPEVPGIVQGALLQSPDGQPLSDLKLLNEDEGLGGGSASTSAVPTLTTSSGEEGSVNQLSSGIFPGGKKNVDGGSSSNDDQTVGAEAGDTVRGDGPPQTPADTPATADANAPTATGKRQVDPAVNNSDACNMRGSGLLPSLLLLLLGLWGFTAL
ncbi:trans-sialidase [Trypanosoma cruzi cruzi]|uniref:Putative trans-sialidase, Group V n=1 Tax=Trypanosoma cruzi TaxID=5693 RepID=A0A2V2UJG5_TRYCR|nr:trans-sialidase [Trypanosoma cruzi cruzi]PWU83652.1 putative trans-sialidase, Group V [Trypanosoma cruzi]